GQLHADLFQVQAGHFFVQLLRQQVHLVLVGALVGPQVDLGQGLVGERVGHHEARVAGGAAQVDQAAFGQQEDRIAVGEDVLVHLRLDVDVLHAREGDQRIDLDLVVEVADVADDGLVLHRAQVLDADDVLVAGGGDVQVGTAQGGFDGVDLEAFHRRLQGADRIDLGDHHARAVGTQRRGAALADVTVAADHGDLAGQHHVHRALEAIGQRLAAAVQVVELALGDRVVDVDRRDQQGAGLGQLVQAVHAGGGFFRNTLPVLDHAGPVARAFLGHALEQVLDDLLFVRSSLFVDPGAAVLELVALVDQQGHVTAVVDHQLRAGQGAVGQGEGQRVQGAVPVLFQRLALPGEHGGAGGGDRRSGVVLGREDVARSPAHVGADVLQGLDQHRG